ncbi:SLC45 family MFS transporter [Pelagicoccus sp. NFK12]|uniref:SLC45 family MFS transporter n=1 Tax=Pelagicoccus enzymogenes TaxID=2773457 RepID=A0A927IIX0_9BACT|nr:MFS transporter [Pelagicoccus enzymogenes]MBD5781274.1 SLC45 family MFS transporter [Pelagicoccus enzymogenes]
MTQQRLSFWQIWNMSFGFLGIQFGWGLQMANMSAIYQYLGADESEIPLLWLAAPITGLVVQPIIGYYSDRTWTRLGRRRPYFLVGAILASLALVAMPNSSTLWMAAGLLWILDASVNVSMEPFRAFVGDKLPEDQRKTGFAMQSLLIGLGAVAASSLPWVFSNVFGMEAGSSEGSAIPQTVKISFYIGAVIFFVAVMYTILTTKENPPEDLEAFEREKAASSGVGHMFVEIFSGIKGMPKAMRQLSVAQFFTWFGLFCLWLYFSPAVATQVFGGKVGEEAYQKGVEWAGVCLSAYNFIAFLFSFALIALTKKYSAKAIHTACLVCGALGLASTALVSNHQILLVSMVGVGIAWASILSMPYAMLSNVIPSKKMGFYMGVFNFFIVLPQIVASLGLGFVVKHLFSNNAAIAVALGGVSLLIAAFSLRFVDENN